MYYDQTSGIGLHHCIIMLAEIIAGGNTCFRPPGRLY
jgi:hypothetical protein